MTIVEFINARLDEDEAVAKSAFTGSFEQGKPIREQWIADEDSVYTVWGDINDPERCSEHEPGKPNDCDDNNVCSTSDVLGLENQWATHIARHDPARVLRQVKALRHVMNVLDGHMSEPTDPLDMIWRYGPIASIWSDHPDYQQEWNA